MAKKKKEHQIFDNMLAQKKGIPFPMGNSSRGNAKGAARPSAAPQQKTFMRKTP